MSRDFEDFKKGEPVTPPTAVSENLLAKVYHDLNPSSWKVFSKLALIHFFTAAAMLSVCPQFGFRLFGKGMGLMGYFMHFGEYGCMLACGSIFLSSSVLIAMLLLRPEEIRVIRNNRLLELGALTLLSLGFFIMVSAAEIVFGFALAWVLGSLLGGILTLEAAWIVRLRLLAVR